MDKDTVLEVRRLAKKLESDPTSRSFVQLADIYLKHDRFDDAIEVLSVGIVHHPSYVAARMVLATAYLGAKRVKDAKAALEAVIEMHPEHVLAHKKLALIYKELNRLGEAIKICNKTLRIDPHDKEVKALLSEIHNVMDDADKFSLPEPFDTVLQETSTSRPSEVETMVEAVLAVDEEPLAQPLMEKQEHQEPILTEYSDRILRQVVSPPPLNVIRLKAWLGTIQEKGGQR
jgi:tetratricopeptide (TPR) repeat protein